MRRLRVVILDLLQKGPSRSLWSRAMQPNFASIMPQVIGVWCEQAGHDVTLVCYTGREDLGKELPDDPDILFIAAYTQTAHLAYALSHIYRQRGTVTALGGSHARCYPHDAVKGAPRSRVHYDMYHYIPEKRDALTRWVQRLGEIVGHDPNDVMKADRIGYQGRGPARTLRRRESYRERKARLAAQGRDLASERREKREAYAARNAGAAGALIVSDEESPATQIRRGPQPSRSTPAQTRHGRL